jgi:membrane fusion protein, adhesin transport system
VKNSGMSRIIIGLTACAVLVFVVWARWAELDQVTRAQAQVIPSGRTQVIQSAEGGIISEINVREGQRVTKGEILVRLDEVQLRAAVEESEAAVAAETARMARIEAELFDRPLVFPAGLEGHPEFVTNQRQLYLRRRETLRASLANLDTTRNLAQQELDMNRPLLETGDVSRSEILRMERGIADIRGEISTLRNEYLQQLQAEYAEAEEKLASSEKLLTQRRSALRSAVMRAPTSGVVVEVAINTVGGVLKPGDTVLNIVPAGEELVVEAKVSPADIAFIRAGQDASVKFDAYDSSIYGTGDGTVTYVSADTLTDQTPQGPQAYYRVRIDVDASTLRPRSEQEVIALQPGMTATAEIITGRTTVFDYLMKPILKTKSEALEER